MKVARHRYFSIFSRWGLTIGVVCAVFTSQAIALSSDREKPIHITSDSADLDDAAGIATYYGNVVMTQGSTQLKGSTITIYTSNRDIQRIVSEGGDELAHYQEDQDKNKGILNAWGETINYNLSTETVELIKQARLVQNGDTFTGDRIEYNQSKEIVNAQGKKGKSSGGRVQMVIKPNQPKG